MAGPSRIHQTAGHKKIQNVGHESNRNVGHDFIQNVVHDFDQTRSTKWSTTWVEKVRATHRQKIKTVVHQNVKITNKIYRGRRLPRHASIQNGKAPQGKRRECIFVKRSSGKRSEQPTRMHSRAAATWVILWGRQACPRALVGGAH